MDPETSKAVVRRYFEMWNSGQVALADEVLSPDYVDHAHPEINGRESVKLSVQKIRAALPDFNIAIEFIISEGNLVAVRGAVHRTQQGTLVISHVIWFIRIIGGKMTELWTGPEAAS
jgi:predicted SnoaL-like aldol condensation-catalyzing enzyme